ncbi:TraB/GumN family protein [Thioclava sp. GXIMD2076]|uniref:TraB/GumN family protein n=1 Tax=unclassified Thioclava TaxID=2621713 RepID=UPI0030CCA66D
MLRKHLKSRLLQAVLVLGGVLAPIAAEAACTGRNLFDAMPRATRMALTEKARQTAYGQGVVWRATKGTQSIILVGTNHVPDPRHLALQQALLPEFDKISALLVEAGPDEEAALQKAMGERSDLMFMADKTLPDMMSQRDWQALRQLGADRGIPAPLLAKMQPSFVMITLSMPRCMLGSLQAGQGGVDKRMMAEAQARNVPIMPLEPFDTLFTLMEGVPQEDEIAMLKSAMEATEDGDATMATMADLYARGEIQLIWEFERQQALDRGEDPAAVTHQLAITHDLLITTRNRNWMPVIEKAAAKGPIMVAAGALHMVGGDGLLTLLAQEGWQISPVMRKLTF